MLSFKDMRSPTDVILVCIRWNAAYPLSYRNIEEMMAEFRQAWVDELRKQLAALFLSVRTICRAVQELRTDDENKPAVFEFPQSKIIEPRQPSAETYRRIKLRLNPNQPDYQQLRERLRGDDASASGTYLQ